MRVRAVVLRLLGLTGLAAVILVAACAATSAVLAERAGPLGPPVTDQGFEFALIGDMPYGQLWLPQFGMLIEAMNADPSLRWVLHAGDIKSGSEPCSDALLRDRLARFQRFQRPFILTPGDNEWTDCHRARAGGYAPLERLQVFRELFYPRPGYTLGADPMVVATQAANPVYGAFPENVRWSAGNVTFATVHMVGSYNGLLRFEGRGASDDAEVAQRTTAAVAWLRETFAFASERDSAGVFLMLHANPHFEKPPGSRARRPYAAFLEALEAEVTRFGRPVLLAHGDTHRYRHDQPLRSSRTGEVIENFSRVETFGGIQMHWVRIRVDAEDPQVFRVWPEIDAYDRDGDSPEG